MTKEEIDEELSSLEKELETEEDKETIEEEKLENLISEENLETEENKESEDEEEPEAMFPAEVHEDNQALNRFLMNPWKQVSLTDRGMNPITNLETELPEVENKSSFEEEKPIDYLTKDPEEEGGIYNSGMNLKNVDPNLSEEEKAFQTQKRLYSEPQRLRTEMRKVEDKEMKYIKPEDMIKKDYLTKKEFFK